MGMIYGATMLLLFISVLGIKKTEKQLNIVNTCILLIVLLLAYQVGVCFAFNAIGIPICLESLSIVNSIIAGIIGYRIQKEKQKQVYYFHKSDLIYTVLITIITLGVAYQNFGFPFQIKYETTDPYIHARAAILFSEKETLLNQEKDGRLQFNHFMPGAYINAGIWMKALSQQITGIDRYQVFIAFDITMFVLIALTMYTCLNRKEHLKFGNVIAFLLTIAFALGYPLNSLLFGFEYLSMSLLVILAIMKVICLYHEKILSKNSMMTSIIFFTMTLFLSYFLFVPVIFVGLGIYFIIENYKKTKKLITRELIITGSITLVLPALLGAMYLILPRYLFPEMGSLSDIAQLEGTAYRNWYSNVLLLLPFCLYCIGKEIKTAHPVILFSILTLLFIIVAMFLSSQKILSTYYLAKLYYLAWIFLFYLTNKVLQNMLEKNTYLPLLVILGYGILLIVSFLVYKDKKIDLGIPETYENITTIAEIYNVNQMILTNQKQSYTYEEIQFFKEALDKLRFASHVRIMGNSEHVIWAHSMVGQNRFKEVKTIDENQEYVIYFKRDTIYQEYKEKLFDKTKIFFENEIGGILVKSNIVE